MKELWYLENGGSNHLETEGGLDDETSPTKEKYEVRKTKVYGLDIWPSMAYITHGPKTKDE